MIRACRAWGLMVVLLAGGAVACTDSSTDATAVPRTTVTSTSPTVTATTTSPSTTTTTRPPSEPGYGGTAVIADDQAPPTLNPFAPEGDHFIVSIIGQAWTTGVWDIDAESLERIPEVVTELPTVANGGVVVNPDNTMTVTYHIREEAVWSDGVPITADDFQFTLDTALATEPEREHVSTYSDVDIIGSEGADKVFSLTARQPTMKHEGLFQWLIAKHVVEGTNIDEDWNTTTWPSGGPFVLDVYEQGNRITFVRNDNYWKTDPETGLQLPYLDSVEFVFIPETEEILRSFKAREVDVIQPPPSIEHSIKPIENLESEGAVIEILHGPIWEHISFQFSDKRLEISPNSCNHNLAFRRAIAHAIDKDAIAEEAYRGYNGPMDSYLQAFTPALSTDAWLRYAYDPDVARALYAVAVAETGIECTATYHTTSNGDIRIRWAHQLDDMMEEAGIPFELDLRDSSVFFGEMLDDGTWDIGEWAWVGSPGLAGVVDIHDLFDPASPPPDGTNYYRWGTPGSDVTDEHTERFAEIVAEMNSTVDETEIIDLIHEAEHILADQVVIIPLVQRITMGAVWANEVGGFQMNSTAASHTWNIEYWYRTDR